MRIYLHNLLKLQKIRLESTEDVPAGKVPLK